MARKHLRPERRVETPKERTNWQMARTAVRLASVYTAYRIKFGNVSIEIRANLYSLYFQNILCAVNLLFLFIIFFRGSILLLTVYILL